MLNVLSSSCLTTNSWNDSHAYLSHIRGSIDCKQSIETMFERLPHLISDVEYNCVHSQLASLSPWPTPSADRITGRLNKFSGELTNWCFLNGGLATAELERHQAQKSKRSHVYSDLALMFDGWLLNLKNKIKQNITWHLIRNKKDKLAILQKYIQYFQTLMYASVTAWRHANKLLVFSQSSLVVCVLGASLT